MARILYGLCGEGLGHASRSRILIHHLKKHHEVFVVAGGKAYGFLSKEFDTIEDIVSARFIYKNNKVRLLITILWTLYQSFTSSPASYFKVKRIVKEFQPDIW